MSDKDMRSKLAMQGLLIFDPSSKADQRKLQQAALATDVGGDGGHGKQPSKKKEPEAVEGWTSKADKKKARKERQRLRKEEETAHATSQDTTLTPNSGTLAKTT